MSTTMKWGLITGAVYIIFSLISNLLGLQDGGGFSILGLVVNGLLFFATLGTIYYGVREIRDTQLSGSLSFGQGFKSGMAMALIAAIIVAIFTFVYISVIDPGMIDTIVATTEAQWEEQNMSEEQIEAARKVMGYVMSPFVMCLIALVSVIFWGVIKSLIAAALLKVDAPPVIPQD